MSLSNSPVAYEDAYQLMDQALADPKGIRAKYPDLPAAIHSRMRCHQARKIDREQNALTYPKGDPKHNTSLYDKLTLRIFPGEGAFWLHFERNEVTAEAIEPLSDNPLIEDAPSNRVGMAVAGTKERDVAEGFDAIQPVSGVRRV